MRYYIQLETATGSAELQLIAYDESVRCRIPNSAVRDDEFALENVPALLVALREAEAVPPRPVTHAEFEQVFQNQSLLPTLSVEQSPFRAFVRVGKAGLWARLALFKALYLFLASEGRHERLDADIALVYCAWQRYNLIKALWELPQESAPVRGVDYEFASAYRALTALLEEERFAYAFHVLWACGRGPTLAYPLIRERLRLALVLHRRETAQVVEKALEQPLPAPRCFQDPPQWKGIQLHARFQDAAGQAEVRRLMRQWLLPRYALDEALRISWLLRWKRSCPAWLRGGLVIGALFAVNWIALVLGWIQAAWAINVSGVVLQISLPLILLLSFLGLDRGTLFNLALPRLFGGIFVGYLPLVLSDDPWRLIPQDGTNSLGFSTIPLLWIISLALTGGYLWGEALKYAEDRRTALWRSCWVLSWGWVVSIFAGVVFSEMGKPIYRTVPGAFHPTILGIPNTIEISIPAVVMFAPMALLIGLIVQMLWEERPVTATVWPSE